MLFSRAAAVAYAHQWAFSRNPAYFAYDHVGGDCTNFISQCLRAGGFAMDDTPVFGWYYRDANQKAPAWTGVEPFWNYFSQRGAVCGPEELSPGDVIQLSFDGERYQHCVLVVGTGREVLVSAHDEDSDFRPLSTYQYAKLRCLHWIPPLHSDCARSAGVW